MVAPLSACFGAFKSEFRKFWSTCMPMFMLVDKSAQSSPLEPGTIRILTGENIKQANRQPSNKSLLSMSQED